MSVVPSYTVDSNVNIISNAANSTHYIQQTIIYVNIHNYIIYLMGLHETHWSLLVSLSLWWSSLVSGGLH